MNSADILMVGRIQSIGPKDREQTLFRINAHSAFFGPSVPVLCQTSESTDLTERDAVQVIIRPIQVVLEDLGSVVHYQGTKIKKLS